MSVDRTFTLEEAEGLLPVLRQLLQTAMSARKRTEEIDQDFQNLIGRILLSGGVQLDPVHTSRLKAERERTGHRLQDAVEEIASSGVQVKDLEMGLLDFPCMVNGRLILLCWKMGEAKIGHWHGAQEGYANRKPLDSSMFDIDKPDRVH